MLNGIDPIIIFQFAALAPTFGAQLAKIPIVAKSAASLIEMPPIPIYLSQSFSGIHIDSEDKNVDIKTDTETMSDGSTPSVDQKGIGSVISINMLAKKDSVGLALLSAMIDQVFDKVTSKEYSITYLHGPITIFRGVLHSYAVSQSADNELLTIKLELSKGEKQPTKKPEIPALEKSTGNVPTLATGG